MTEVMERPLISDRDRFLVPVKVAQLRVDHISRIVQGYLTGDSLYSDDPNYVRIAKAAIELQKAYEDRGKRRYDPAMAQAPGWRDTAEEARQRAISLFNKGYPKTGVSSGIKKNQIPHHAGLGEYVVVTFAWLGDTATVAGFVTDYFEWPRGKAWVIRLIESNNSYNPHPGGWRFLSLWAPSGDGMAGFL